MDLGTRIRQNNSAANGWESDDSPEARLQRAQEDLELISYVASHDLEAPLRAILRYCEETKTNLPVTADEKTKYGLEKIGDEAARLKILMQGLLEYTRMITYAPSYVSLDMNEIIMAALAPLDSKIQASKAKIVCDALPSVRGHRGRITRLFVNLLDNALKFNRSLRPEIRITAENEEGFIGFCIEDNGIGIDEEYHNIIFTLFQRLHREEDYPGYGIGLALCRKIVESHGGKIWVESTLGAGSRFRFLLPVSEP